MYNIVHACKQDGASCTPAESSIVSQRQDSNTAHEYTNTQAAANRQHVSCGLTAPAGLTVPLPGSCLALL